MRQEDEEVGRMEGKITWNKFSAPGAIELLLLIAFLSADLTQVVFFYLGPVLLVVEQQPHPCSQPGEEGDECQRLRYKGR